MSGIVPTIDKRLAAVCQRLRGLQQRSMRNGDSVSFTCLSRSMLSKRTVAGASRFPFPSWMTTSASLRMENLCRFPQAQRRPSNY